MERLSKDWVVGKVWDSLTETARLVETLNENKDEIPKDVFERLRNDLWSSIKYQTQVIFAVNGAEDFDHIHVVEEILDKGRLGLDKNLQKYKIIEDSQLLKFERERLNRDEIERPELIQRIFELSQNEMQDSRREIYEECERFGHDFLTKQILDLIEDVTQGTKSWSQFQREVILVLTPHLEVAK